MTKGKTIVIVYSTCTIDAPSTMVHVSNHAPYHGAGPKAQHHGAAAPWRPAAGRRQHHGAGPQARHHNEPSAPCVTLLPKEFPGGAWLKLTLTPEAKPEWGRVWINPTFSLEALQSFMQERDFEINALGKDALIEE